MGHLYDRAFEKFVGEVIIEKKDEISFTLYTKFGRAV